ncbi:excalibur calcium-binding domain-containing protein [Mycolicibacterium vanbaalenii]|nr:excalibur calcium-binding domain-containing protein [Mycolicibacterium vanbaalenii]MCV7130800.1 excalibur calcium-binding domain-containing protein [Mycolicibacterium vanbaalenii PYR-1]
MFMRAIFIGSAVGAMVLGGAGTAMAQPGSSPLAKYSQARANGYEDIFSSSQYYGPHLDRDGDGIGCES